jgi:two-component system osmolarity sensor histidine kinase EnvZ
LLIFLILLVLVTLILLFQYDRERLLITQFGDNKVTQIQALRAALRLSLRTERSEVLIRFGRQYNAQIFEERRRPVSRDPAYPYPYFAPKSPVDIPYLEQIVPSPNSPFRSGRPFSPFDEERHPSFEPRDAFLDLERYLKRMLGEDTQIRVQPGRQLLWIRFSAQGSYYWAGFTLPEHPQARDVSSRAFFLLLIITGMLVLSAFAFARYLAQPLSKLAYAVDMVGRGKTLPALPDIGPSEVIALNRGFNNMTRRLQQVDNDRALLLAGVSHDLRTPLARLRLSIEVSDIDETERDLMVEDIEAIDRIIDQFLDFARDDNQSNALLQNANTLIENCVAYHRRFGHDVRFTPDPKLPNIMLRTISVERLISNLINNALNHGKPPVEITTGFNNKSIWIEVSDHGTGFPKEKRERLKEPFRRVSDARSTPEGKLGAGLGLAIVDRIARLHGGTVDLLNTPRGGALVRVVLSRKTKEEKID